MQHRKRGRPPHPDILTPREWEVLEMLRQSLSNEEIAERLDISVAGVKYHVSEILSKLGVSSRQEAARWRPREERRLRWAALPLVAKASGLAVAAAAIVALGLLAYGVTQTSGDDPASFDPVDPRPGDDPERDLILLDAGLPGRIAKVEVRPADGGDLEEGFSFTPPSPVSEVDAWLITVTTWSERFPGFLSGPAGRPDPPPGCYQSTTWSTEVSDLGNYPSAANKIDLVDDSECEIESIDRDTAIVIAGSQESRKRDVDPTPLLVSSTNLGSALATLAEEVFPSRTPNAPLDREVWLVTYTAALHASVPTPSPATPGPTPVPECSHIATVVDATTGDVLLSESLPIGPCSGQ